jgi:hypothetical protein
MFPIDTTKRLDLNNEDYIFYEKRMLGKREQWVRENILAGKYHWNIQLANNPKEEVGEVDGAFTFIKIEGDKLVL